MPCTDLSPPVSQGVLSFLIGEELLLFSPHLGALFRLNPSAALIWSCCEDGLDRPAIVNEMMQVFHLPAAQAQQDLDTTLSDWQDRGLLGRTDTSPIADTEDPVDDEPIPEPRTKVRIFPVERCYRMFATVYRLRFAESGMLPYAESVFAHLSVDSHRSFNVTLDVQHDPQGYFLLRDDTPVAWCHHEEELAPLLHGQLVADAYERTEKLIAFHSAAVSNGTECLIFPALSGSGKSTLTAALMATGFRYCTDELVLLQPQTHRVQAIAAAVGIKPGSWEALQAFYPGINELPTHLRLDGQQVRYLLPDKSQLANDTTLAQPVRALVFPVYRDGATPQLESLTPADALYRLTEAGSDMDGVLDGTRVTELVDWIVGMDSYELCYGDLQDAIAHVRQLLS